MTKQKNQDEGLKDLREDLEAKRAKFASNDDPCSEADCEICDVASDCPNHVLSKEPEKDSNGTYMDPEWDAEQCDDMDDRITQTDKGFTPKMTPGVYEKLVELQSLIKGIRAKGVSSKVNDRPGTISNSKIVAGLQEEVSKLRARVAELEAQEQVVASQRGALSTMIEKVKKLSEDLKPAMAKIQERLKKYDEIEEGDRKWVEKLAHDIGRAKGIRPIGPGKVIGDIFS